MSLTHTACAFHSTKIAVTKCTRCNRSICLEDKKVYESSRSSGTGNMSSSYIVNMEFCHICYLNQLEKDLKTGFVDYFFWDFITICIININSLFSFRIIRIFHDLLRTKNQKRVKDKGRECKN